MAKVKPAAPNSKISLTSKGLEINIPAKKNLFLLAFMMFWLVGWFLGEVFVSIQLFGSGMPAPAYDTLFLSVWLLLWTLGGFSVLLVVLWQIAGSEHILITYNSVIIKRGIFDIGFEKEYDWTYVKNFRVSSPSFNPADPKTTFKFFGIGSGPLAFDYGAKTIRFGGSIEEGEANMLLERIRDRF